MRSNLALAALCLIVSCSAFAGETLESLFTTAKTAGGKAVIENLKQWRTISDAEVDETKAVIIAAVAGAGVKAFSQLKPVDLKLSYHPFHGISLYSKEAMNGFSFFIKPDGDLGMGHVYVGEEVTDAVNKFMEAVAAQNRARRIFGSEVTLFGDAKDLLELINARAFPHDVTADQVTAELRDGGKDDDGQERLYVRILSKNNNPRHEMTVWSDGRLISGKTFQVSSGPALFAKVAPEDRRHLDVATFREMLKKKPEGLNERIAALYDALSVLMADKRYSLETISAVELFRNRGIGPSEKKIVLDSNIGPISGGELTLTSSKLGELKLTFDAGHINVGADLNKPEAWLYGKGNVGNHRALYEQLSKSKWGRD